MSVQGNFRKDITYEKVNELRKQNFERVAKMNLQKLASRQKRGVIEGAAGAVKSFGDSKNNVEVNNPCVSIIGNATLNLKSWSLKNEHQ
jgi:hypothetical protein